MTDNPLTKVLQRLTEMAVRDGVVFCRIEWNADQEEFLFTPIRDRYVEVNYEKNDD